MMNSKGKMRRLDSDLKRVMMTTALSNHEARTPGALARANHMPESTVKSWMPTHMGEYRAAMMLTFADRSQAVESCFDASRVGCPKEETLTVGAIRVGNNCAGWLAPQALVTHHAATLMRSGFASTFFSF